MEKQYTGLMTFDSFELGTSRTIDPETGFLTAPAHIARAGVQLYRARELGLEKHGVPGDQIVRLHRPDDVLFSPATMSSFEGKPVINGVPHTTTTSKNWKDIAAGDVHGIHREGNLLAADKMIVRDKDAVDDVLSGKKYLSIGYNFDLNMTPGTTAGGDAYDGTQTNVVGNHVLITDSPRGGPTCTIADSNEEVQGARIMKKVTINGLVVEVGDTEAGYIETLQTELTAARSKQPSITYKVGDASQTITGDSAIVKLITERDATITELKSKVLTGDALDKLIVERTIERTRIVGDAVKMVPDFKADSKPNLQIVREVLTTVTGADATAKGLVEAVLAGKSIGDSSDDVATTAFNALGATFAGKKTTAVAAGDTSMAAALLSVVTTGDAKVADKPTGRAAFLARKPWETAKQ